MRSELLAGVHNVGKPLREEELAARFGVHRMQRACEDQNVQAVLDEDAAFHQRLLLIVGLKK